MTARDGGSAIKVGDLVMVVRAKPCCGANEGIGGVHEVSGLVNLSRCYLCGTVTDELAALIDGPNEARVVSRLIRIDPPAIPESIERHEEVPA